MSLIAYLIMLAVTGLVVGAIARLILPGRDPMSIPMTMGIGILGSLAAGLVAMAIFGGRNGGGFILSVVFATLLVWLVRRSRTGGRHAHNAHGRRSSFGL